MLSLGVWFPGAQLAQHVEAARTRLGIIRAAELEGCLIHLRRAAHSERRHRIPCLFVFVVAGKRGSEEFGDGPGGASAAFTHVDQESTLLT
jgi:hypothetical protein